MTVVAKDIEDRTVWNRRLCASDRSAFTALFHALYPDLRWYACELTGDEAVAEDLVQEAFIRLWDNHASIDPERSVRAYLYVTVRNRAFNHQRDAMTRKKLVAAMEDPPSPMPPDEPLRAGQLGRYIRAWIDQLPERRREAFELSRFCGLSHQEIAAVMGLSLHTVEKHITRALSHLRQRLVHVDPDLLKP